MSDTVTDDYLQWVAVYEDDTVLQQHVDGHENRFRDIERDRLREIQVFDMETSRPLLVMANVPGKTPLFRRRVAKDGETNVERWRAYLYGWRGGNLNWIGPDKVVVQMEDFIEGHPVFYPIEFVEEEM